MVCKSWLYSYLVHLFLFHSCTVYIPQNHSIQSADTYNCHNCHVYTIQKRTLSLHPNPSWLLSLLFGCFCFVSISFFYSSIIFSPDHSGCGAPIIVCVSFCLFCFGSQWYMSKVNTEHKNYTNTTRWHTWKSKWKCNRLFSMWMVCYGFIGRLSMFVHSCLYHWIFEMSMTWHCKRCVCVCVCAVNCGVYTIW